jgi:23S rRNA (cytidine1920-2'-O)/16S rRNA (cytidine1409-2'-O)-methyltransferase
MPAMSTTASRQRLDLVLVERGLAPSRERAQALIASGLVEVDGAPAHSAATPVGAVAQVRLRGRDHPWASRGGLKLDAALDAFAIDCAGRTCLDAGASTGGFTDVLLSRGAAAVYAVDVGRGLLEARLAADPRVRVLDGTNLRSLSALPGPPPDLVTLDLAFISLRLVMPAVAALVARPADLVALFKPQFELGREAVGRGGVVRDAALAKTGVADFLHWMSETFAVRIAHDPRPAAVRGAKGNQEWMVHVRFEREEERAS